MPSFLIVERDGRSLELIRRALAEEGWTVRAFTDPQAGLASARAEPPDLAFVSTEVPRATGMLGELSPAVAIIGEAQEALNAELLQAEGELRKPFTREQLMATVRGLLAASGAPVMDAGSGEAMLTSEDIFGDLLAEVEEEEEVPLETASPKPPPEAAPKPTPPATPKNTSPRATDIDRKLEETLSGVLDLGRTRKLPTIPAKSPKRRKTADVEDLLSQTLSGLELPSKALGARGKKEPAAPPPEAPSTEAPPPASPMTPTLPEAVDTLATTRLSIPTDLPAPSKEEPEGKVEPAATPEASVPSARTAEPQRDSPVEALDKESVAEEFDDQQPGAEELVTHVAMERPDFALAPDATAPEPEPSETPPPTPATSPWDARETAFIGELTAEEEERGALAPPTEWEIGTDESAEADSRESGVATDEDDNGFEVAFDEAVEVAESEDLEEGIEVTEDIDFEELGADRPPSVWEFMQAEEAQEEEPAAPAALVEAPVKEAALVEEEAGAEAESVIEELEPVDEGVAFTEAEPLLEAEPLIEPEPESGPPSRTAEEILDALGEMEPVELDEIEILGEETTPEGDPLDGIEDFEDLSFPEPQPEPETSDSLSESRSITPEPGQKFGHYTLIERIAVGGMAEVWKARMDGIAGFQKTVAIKKILPHLTDNKEFEHMFVDEAKVVAELNHPNIVHIYDLGKIQDDYYITMEYVEGKDLRSILNLAQRKRRPMPPDLALHLIQRLAGALDYAHRKRDSDDQPLGLVHRDVSPQNVLISYEGEVKLCDFGIVKVVTKASQTQMGALKGKLQYMSPEQAWGKPVDGRTDLFALGSILFEVVTGERLFAGESELSVLEAVRECRVRGPREVSPAISEALDSLVLKAVAEEADDRFQTAGEMREALDRLLLDNDARPNSADLAAYLRDLINAKEPEESDNQAEESTAKEAPAAPPPDLADLEPVDLFLAEEAAPETPEPAGLEELRQRFHEDDATPPAADAPALSTPSVGPVVEAIAPAAQAPTPARGRSRLWLLVLLFAVAVVTALYVFRDQLPFPLPGVSSETPQLSPASPPPATDSPQEAASPSDAVGENQEPPVTTDPALDTEAELERLRQQTQEQMLQQEEELRRKYEQQEKELQRKLDELQAQGES